MRGDLTEDVLRLLRDHISSLEQLEILLLLRAQDDKGWTAKEVSAELRSGEASATKRLEDLQKRGFLASLQDPQGAQYRYGPSDEWIRQAVDQLDGAYIERRYSVIEIIFAKPIDNLRVYAGAFRFRKDGSDG